ncbi:MAG: FTR1 family protein [Anaerolineales bacterium]|nr:FTR1 family protein [Anaerolineales bacterium]
MFVSFLLTLREGLEAALIVGIIFGYLRKLGQTQYYRWAGNGVLAAVVLSAVLAFGITVIGAELEGPAEQLFEGVTMMLAVAVLTWMIFWMRSQARTLKSTIEGEVQKAILGGTAWGLAAATFLAVFREGVETALFLGAAAFQTSGLETLVGALIGLSVAAVVGNLIYASAVRLNVRLFFDVTSLLLLVFAAGLFMHGIHEFQELGLLPEVIKPLWDTSAFASESSLLGQFLRTLVGYTPTPSLVEILAYVAYWLITLLAVRWWTARLAAGPAKTAVTRA